MYKINFRSHEVETPDHMSEIVYFEKGCNHVLPRIGVVELMWAEIIDGEDTGGRVDYTEECPGEDWGVIAVINELEVSGDITWVYVDEWNKVFGELL